jgi:hypothetical protein
VNDGWTTCEWRPSETTSFPGYDIAFDKVYEKIKDRTEVPQLIGPESANLGRSSFGNTFSTFADAIKDKPIPIFAYHPYNFHDGSTQNEITAALQMLKDDYGDKPNIMTEFSGMSWYKTAEFIYSTLKDGNSSGYIYWELMWAEDNDHAMIKVTDAGNYELTPYYHLIKHFSKSIDKGYARIELEIVNAPIKAVAFMNPAKNKISVLLLNSNSYSSSINFEIKDNTAANIAGWQSTEDDLYKELSYLSLDKELTLQGQSITTIEIEF